MIGASLNFLTPFVDLNLTLLPLFPVYSEARKPWLDFERIGVAQAVRAAIRESVAGIAECSVALINTYYSTMTKLRRAVMRVAVKREILPVIAYGLVTGNQQALKASPGLRGRAMSGKLCTDEWARS